LFFVVCYCLISFAAARGNVAGCRLILCRIVSAIFRRPWHVFVDTAPDTDTDFEVAATFDEEPELEELNMAIVECLEGSEREDEIVAQQMQQALEEGQLDRVSDMIGEVLDFDDEEDASDEEDDNDDDDFDMFAEDSV
jgi:hypothetical protein